MESFFRFLQSVYVCYIALHEISLCFVVDKFFLNISSGVVWVYCGFQHIAFKEPHTSFGGNIVIYDAWGQVIWLLDLSASYITILSETMCIIQLQKSRRANMRFCISIKQLSISIDRLKYLNLSNCYLDNSTQLSQFINLLTREIDLRLSIYWLNKLDKLSYL